MENEWQGLTPKERRAFGWIAAGVIIILFGVLASVGVRAAKEAKNLKALHPPTSESR